MSFEYRDGELCAEGVPMAAIAARFGTPCYVYSRAAIEARWRAYASAFGDRSHQIHYAVKANGNLAVLDVLRRLGSGFDIVSGGELARVLAAGAEPRRVVFSGVGKRRDEIATALERGVGCINVESLPELARVERVAAERGSRAPIAVRVNPDVDAKTHPYISTGLNENKFGVPMAEALAVYRRAAASRHLAVIGVACHIGSQLTDLAPFADAIDRVMALVDRLRGIGVELAQIDVGGGLGVAYRDEAPPSIDAYVKGLLRAIPPRFHIGIEPGRSIVAEAGALLTAVEYVKDTPARRFVICDAAMTELIRPALYDAWHAVRPIRQSVAVAAARPVDLVGPVCETADVLASDRNLDVAEGDLLGIMNAGAYGFVMASNYNARPRPPEVMVDGTDMYLVRDRESLAALMAGEHPLS